MPNPDCSPDASSCNSTCCRLPYICWTAEEEKKKACSCCPTKYNKQGNVLCRNPSIYNTPYYVYRPNKYCAWRGYSQRELLRFFPNETAARATTNGQARVQGGRWNHSTTNTKLYPIISECKAGTRCVNPSSPNTCRLQPATNQSTLIQSGKLFKNTDYEMPKKELMSYLARNRKYLHR